MNRPLIAFGLFALASLCALGGRVALGQLPGTFAPVGVSLGGGAACTPNTQGGGNDGNVVALLHFDNSGTDKSLSPHNLTLNGGAVYSTTQSKFGGYSLSIPTAGTSFAQQANGLVLGTGDLTVEGWIWLGASATYWGWIGDDQSSTILNYTAPNLAVQISSTTNFTQSGSTVSVGAWHHMAVTRPAVGGVARMWVDGVEQTFSSGSSSGNFGSASAGLKIGRAYSATYVMPANSFIDEVRISDSIRYTGNFTPPTLPFCDPVPPAPPPNNGVCTYNTEGGGTYANNVRLYHLNNSLADTSTSARAATIQGAAAFSNAQSKFGGYSLLNATAAAATNGLMVGPFQINGDFTFEGWFYNTNNYLYQLYMSDGGTSFMLSSGYFAATLSTGEAYDYGAGTTVARTSSTPPLNAWNHLAYVRKGTAVAIYLNGKSQALATSAASSGRFGNNVANVCFLYYCGSSYGFIGYVNDIRLSNVARYSANFTPPAYPWCDN